MYAISKVKQQQKKPFSSNFMEPRGIKGGYAKPKTTKNHIYIIGTLGFGFGLALLLDALFGNSNDLAVNKEVNKNASITQAGVSGKKDTLPRRDHTENGINDMAVLDQPRIDNYIKKYKKAKKKKEREENAPLIEKINANAYRGDGSASSRRLYLIAQAYKASREATPVIVGNLTALPDFDMDDSDIETTLAELEEEEKELIELTEIAEKDEDMKTGDQREEKIDQIQGDTTEKKEVAFTKEEWEAKDRELMMNGYPTMVS